ncbi:MAG TPA: nitrilase-related carbon-nitrogen hydrolase, partial [Acidimicrobiia bacterium]|nr:nitrilase-related carbon-nitrogen hydrolase [Acidimicrobiia bacterium]
ELTRQIEPGSVDLVVWSEGSTGSFNADPVQNPEIGEAIGAEARRIGAWFLVGSDRPVSETHWINANVVFNLGDGVAMGSVISFEGGFSRYPRQNAQAGANLIVVATNEGSYGTTRGSDQFIGMTRMRAAELGTPVIHAAVTGKSVFIGDGGQFTSESTGLGTMEILIGAVAPSARSIYANTGDVVMIVAALIGLGTWWRARHPLVVSAPVIDEEE